MVINFAILVGGYYLLGKKPIAAGLQNRRDTISKEIEEAQLMKREAEERAKAYQAKLETLQEELQHARLLAGAQASAGGEHVPGRRRRRTVCAATPSFWSNRSSSRSGRISLGDGRKPRSSPRKTC